MPQHLINPLIQIAQRAGEKMLTFYQKDPQTLSVAAKADSTPVTAADLASHHILHAGLTELTPDIPVLSEEGEQYPWTERAGWQQFWCVDPLDGTKEFIAATDEFCICIALITGTEPTLGLIYLPTTGQCYYALKGQGAYRVDTAQLAQSIHCQSVSADHPLRISISRRHTGPRINQILQQLAPVDVIRCGSAIKFAKIAQGEVDVYPCVGKTQAWDSAAGQILVEEAGGQVIDLSGQRLTYNQQQSDQNPKFIAVGDRQYNWQHLLDALV